MTFQGTFLVGGLTFWTLFSGPRNKSSDRSEGGRTRLNTTNTHTEGERERERTKHQGHLQSHSVLTPTQTFMISNQNLEINLSVKQKSHQNT